MAIGNFRESNESYEVNETKENTDNTEKPRNQILETPKSYDDDFDNRMDSRERKNESGRESKDSVYEPERGGGEGKASLLDKMRNLFSKRENNDSNEGNEGEKNKETSAKESADNGSSFRDKLRESAPSMEEQAEQAKEFSGREEYLEDREKKEQARQDHPDLKSWELSPEQLADAKRGQNNMENSEKREENSDNSEESNMDNNESEGRTPGGDAWERRFGRTEGEE